MLGEASGHSQTTQAVIRLQRTWVLSLSLEGPSISDPLSLTEALNQED